ncbi:MAG: hypothetical protein BGP04_00860 [Rhizobiales bacterium 62-17]|nr:porin [Hyphomicrobiales bacterium]OJY04014.1 MAG: hypothetical protein BGP04_00860 [Rhizobiales bacterium 62-17]
MRVSQGCLGAVTCLLLVGTAAQAAGPQPSRKAPAAERTASCEAYGPGFVRVQGSDTCIKVGGRVRVEGWFTPSKNAVSPSAAPAR